jgi:hypothetical protein
MILYNNKMDDNTVEPVDVQSLFTEFSDYSLAELMVIIKELRQALDHEKKVHSYDELKLQKAEEQIELLTTRINTATHALNGTVEEQD